MYGDRSRLGGEAVMSAPAGDGERPEAPHHRRRRDDLANSAAMLDVVRFLMARPTGDQIAQHLVLNVLTAQHARSAVVSLFGTDGYLHPVGAFGMAASALERYRTLSMWDPSPMSEAVRGGEGIILPTVEEVEERYPWLGANDAPYEPLTAWPLSLPSQRVGAIQVTFTEAPDTDLLRNDVTGVAAVLALYLSLLRNPAGNGGREAAAPDGDEGPGAVPPFGIVDPLAPEESLRAPARRLAPQALSERQLSILGLMAKGLTNAQISKRVGFSESTVRQETMAIYRFFGVGGRREAVRLAGMRGLLDVTTP